MEWYVDAIKHVTDVDDKQAAIDAISTAKVETIYGPVDFTMPAYPTLEAEVVRPVPNCLHMPTAAAQRLKGDKWLYEKYLVSNKFVPGAEITKKVQEIQYSPRSVDPTSRKSSLHLSEPQYRDAALPVKLLRPPRRVP